MRASWCGSADIGTAALALMTLAADPDLRYRPRAAYLSLAPSP